MRTKAFGCSVLYSTIMSNPSSNDGYVQLTDMESGKAGPVAMTESTSGGTPEATITTTGRTTAEVKTALLALVTTGVVYVMVDGVRQLASDVLSSVTQ